MRFPSRVQTGPNKGTLVWLPLLHHRVLQILHNPRYAGAFVYGRRRQRRLANGGTRHSLQPREAWTSLIPDAHPGYITWAQYEANLARLTECAAARGEDRRTSPPREGPALLQGLVVCGRCGKRMSVRYHHRREQILPEYLCQRSGIEDASAVCARVAGEGVDARVGELLLDTITPLALEVALVVQAEMEGRAVEADVMRAQHVERAPHGAESARRRYLAVDPENRLVAANLEADWNDSLRALTLAQEDYERQSARATPLADADKARVASLASDFPALWSDPRTPQRERKRMVRLLLEDVTLSRDDRRISAQVRFKSGTTASFEVPIGLPAPEARRTPPAVVAEIDRLLEAHTEPGVAAELNRKGVLSGTGQAFTTMMVHHIRVDYGLASREQRLRAQGLIDIREMARHLGVCTQTVKRWRYEGLLSGEPIDGRGEHYYRIPTDAPRKAIGRPPGSKNRSKR